MDTRDMSVPEGFPGEHRKMSLIDGSASIVFFTYITLLSDATPQERQCETYLIDTQAETSPFSPFSPFCSKFKVYLDDADVIYLRAH